MSNNKSQRELGLLPKGADQGLPPLAAPQLAPGLTAEVEQILRTKVGQGMAFEVSPDVFDRIEFGSVGRQMGQHQIALRPFHVPAHRPAAMHRQTVPDDQQFARNLAAEVAEKLRRLPALDAALIETKIKLPPGDASDDGKLAPRMTEDQLRGLAFGGPSAHDAGTL